MKIDLHLHTQCVKSGEPEGRNISSELFCDKMINSNVGIASITNHNLFDKEEYIEIKKIFKERKYNILLLPGVEEDVFIIKNNKKIMKQFNIIFSNETNLNIIVEKIKNYQQTSKSIDDLKKIILNEKVLIYLDHKRHKDSDKWWSTNETIEYLDKLDVPIIYDSPNSRTHFVLQAKRINSLIGSDLEKWDEYERISSNLIDIDIKIENFDNLINVLKYDENFLNVLLKQKEVKEFKELKTTKNRKEIKINDNICIYEGLNIIFGPKASGKTCILEGIYNQQKNKSIFYESSKLENEYKNFINENCYPFENLKNIKQNIESNLNSIIEYDERLSFNPLKEIKFFVENTTNIVFHKVFSNYANKLLKEDTKIKNRFLSNILKEINELLNYFNDKKFEIIKNDFFSETQYKFLNEWKIELIKKYKNINKEYWKTTYFQKIYSKLNNVILNSTGKTESKKNVGLFEKWSKRKIIIDKIEKLKNSTYNDLSFTHAKFNLKNRGELNLISKLNSIDFNNPELSKKYLMSVQSGSKEKISEIKENLTKNEFSKIVFTDSFKEIISNILKDSGNNFLKQDNLIVNNKEEIINLSNGEKALLILFNKFNKIDENKKFILLDEPDVYLSPENLIDDLIPKISNLKLQNKFIIITTNNSALGINSIPFNMIYREKINENNYLTYIGNPWKNNFVNVNNEKEQIEFKEMLIQKFEGGKDHFNFRKEIYEK